MSSLTASRDSSNGEERFEFALHVDENSTEKELISEVFNLFNDNKITCRFKVSFYVRIKIFVQLKTFNGVPSACLLVRLYDYERYSGFDEKDEVLRTDLHTWQLIGTRRDYNKVCKFYLILKSCAIVPFKTPFEDTEFTDFTLFGDNDDLEGVSVHRNVLATSSPVLKSMLLGDWKEAKQGNVQLTGVSKNTLQHFKEYIYLRKIPENPSDYAKLITLASYYMLSEFSMLERDGAKLMADKFRPENAWEWFEYCVQQKNDKLLLLRLQYTTSSSWKINEYATYFSNVSNNPVFKLERPQNTLSSYKLLYEDTNFMDFELRVELDDGKVSVHRLVLAMFSPVLKTLLLGDWKEADHGYLQPADVSKDTLQQFKDYIYLKKVPASSIDCAKLIPLASYYQMPELERDVCIKIADNLKPENIWEWFEYCVQHKNDYLLVTILKNIYEEDKIKHLKEYFSTSS